MDRYILLFALILHSLYVFHKALSLRNIGFQKKLCGVAFSAALAYGVYLLWPSLPNIRYILMGAAMWAFATIITKTRPKLALNTIVLSAAVSQGALVASLFIFSGIRVTFFPSMSGIVLVFITVIMSATIIFLYFRFSRYKNGFPFLKKRESVPVGPILSGIIVWMVKVFYSGDASYEMMLFSLIGAVFGITGLIFWIKDGITRVYQERMWQRERQERETELAAKEKELREIRRENESMGKQIHSDSKMLPSMFMMARRKYDTEAARIEIESQVEQYMGKRAGTISRIRDCVLPVTHNGIIDNAMLLMWSKADQKAVRFDIQLSGNFPEWLGKAIPAVELGLLFLELIDNAIIAASHSDDKRVLAVFGYSEGSPTLTVLDSGIPFRPDILTRLGLEKASSHLGDGGSGFGYITISEILRECGASFRIRERGHDGFTKSVTVRFDGKGEYIARTFSGEELSLFMAG